MTEKKIEQQENEIQNGQKPELTLQQELADPERLFRQTTTKRFNFQRGNRPSRPRDLRTSIKKREEAPVTEYNFRQFVDALVESNALQAIIGESLKQVLEGKYVKGLMETRIHLKDHVRELRKGVAEIREKLDSLDAWLDRLEALAQQAQTQDASTPMPTPMPTPMLSTSSAPPDPDPATVVAKVRESAETLKDSQLVRAVIKSMPKFTLDQVYTICRAIRPEFGGNYPRQAIYSVLRRYTMKENPSLAKLEGVRPATYKWVR